MNARVLLGLWLVFNMGCSGDSFSGKDGGGGDASIADGGQDDGGGGDVADSGDGGVIDAGPRAIPCGGQSECGGQDRVCCANPDWSKTSCVAAQDTTHCAGYLTCVDSRDCPVQGHVCCAKVTAPTPNAVTVDSTSCVPASKCVVPDVVLCGAGANPNNKDCPTPTTCKPNTDGGPPWVGVCSL